MSNREHAIRDLRRLIQFTEGLVGLKADLEQLAGVEGTVQEHRSLLVRLKEEAGQIAAAGVAARVSTAELLEGAKAKAEGLVEAASLTAEGIRATAELTAQTMIVDAQRQCEAETKKLRAISAEARIARSKLAETVASRDATAGELEGIRRELGVLRQRLAG